MPSTRPINEGFFADVAKVVSNWGKQRKKNASDNSQMNALRSTSIARATQKLVFSFPVICSDAVSPDTAMMITKAVERNCTSMLQMLLTSMYLTGYNGADVISKFHTNMGMDMDLSDYIDKAAGIADDIKDAKNRASAVADLFKESYTEFEKAFKESLNSYYPESSFSEHSLNDFFVTEDYKGYTVHLTEATRRTLENGDDEEADRNRREAQKFANDTLKARKAAADATKAEYDAALAQKKYYDYDEDRRNARRDSLAKAADARTRAAQAKDKAEQERADRERRASDSMRKDVADLRKASSEAIKSRHDYLTKQLLPSDAQKANELQPTLMLIRYIVPNDKDGVADTQQEFIAGVKAHLTPIPSSEIIEQFGKYLANRLTNLQLAKATTGEIKFSQDLMAAVKDAKLDAKKDSLSTTSPIWRMLQARSAASGARRVAHARNTAAAITTLVITQQEVEIIQMDYDLDLMNPANAMKFMQTYNLLCFVIVDDSTDTARFLYDAEKFYSNYSYTSLERENKGNGLSERQIVNLIGHAH